MIVTKMESVKTKYEMIASPTFTLGDQRLLHGFILFSSTCSLVFFFLFSSSSSSFLPYGGINL